MAIELTLKRCPRDVVGGLGRWAVGEGSLLTGDSRNLPLQDLELLSLQHLQVPVIHSCIVKQGHHIMLLWKEQGGDGCLRGSQQKWRSGEQCGTSHLPPPKSISDREATWGYSSNNEEGILRK